MNLIVCTAVVGNILVCVWVRPFWRRKCYFLGWKLSWWSHLVQNYSRNIECRKIQKQYSWSYRSTLSATAKLWSRLSTWQCKIARVFQDFLNQNQIRVLPWPALSPDLLQIEHLWDELGRRVRHLTNPPETLQELCDALVHEWNNIPEAFIQRLIGSMRRSCEAVVAARGGDTRYWTPQTFILPISVCQWFVLIMMLRNVVDIALFVMPIWI
jgi:hypothetical protein